LRQTLDDTVRTLSVRAQTKGLELVCDIPQEAPDALVGDAGRLRQVLLNLVGNAIKFTREGEVVVRVEVAEGTAPEGQAVLRFVRSSHPSEQVDVPPSVASHEAVPATGVAPLRILVAEDSEFNSRHLERLLGRRGHAVRVATDGREALNLVGEGTFDLLLLDVHMPELDGFQ